MGIRELAVGVALAATMTGLSSCGGEDRAANGDAVTGKQLFAENGCGGCHTFAAAGSKGTEGPDLDVAGPSPTKVVSQLQFGGGLMPSFSDKLSAKERKDLAAFVGATQASGKPVAAPFKPDKTTLAECEGTSTFECYEQAFGNLAFEDGPKVALARFLASQSNTTIASNCHRILHRMGSAALAHFKDKVAPAFAQGSAYCSSGYYHGIIERGFLGQPTSQLTKVARRLCADPQFNRNPHLSYQCLHGLGHGVMIYSGYNMPLSLRVCDGLQDTFATDSCTGAVFMENFTNFYGVKSKYLRANDPIYPCNAVKERQKLQCYQLVTSNILKSTGYDLPKTVAGCRQSEPRWVDMCYQSLGRDISGLAGRSASKAHASCKLAGKFQSSCVYSVAREIVNADAKGERSARFCRMAPVNLRPRCFNGMGSVLISLFPEQSRVRAECRRLTPSRYVKNCVSGAQYRT